MQNLKNHKEQRNKQGKLAKILQKLTYRSLVGKSIFIYSLFFIAHLLLCEASAIAETKSNIPKNQPKNLLYRESLAFIEAKDYKAAVNSLTTFLIENSSSEEAYFFRGKAFHELGILNKASSDYIQAIKLNPKFYRAHNNLGLIYGQAKRFDLAIKSFTKAISTNPQPKEAYNNRGVAKAATGDSKGAISDFTESINIDNGYLEPLLNRSFVFEMVGKLDKACEDWKAASLKGSRDANAWHKAQCKDR